MNTLLGPEPDFRAMYQAGADDSMAVSDSVFLYSRYNTRWPDGHSTNDSFQWERTPAPATPDELLVISLQLGVTS